MANTPALPTPYITLANAEIVNAGVTEWDAASETEKNNSLSYGRAFIDQKYSCNTFDEDDAPAEIQMANALFAVEYLKGVLFDEPSTNVVEESVKAGSVSAKTKYARATGTSVIDPFPTITAILYGTCYLNSANTRSVSLIRS
jgi:hypothetical protein